MGRKLGIGSRWMDREGHECREGLGSVYLVDLKEACKACREDAIAWK